jgi:hypothetical protein
MLAAEIYTELFGDWYCDPFGVVEDMPAFFEMAS